MDRIKIIESFLMIIAEIAKNDIEIDANLVYSNLINTTKEDISNYYNIWQVIFEKMRNVSMSSDKNYCKFRSYGNSSDSLSKVKLYIPLDKNHIYNGVNEIVTFLSQNKILYSMKVSKNIRIDNISITVDDLFTAEKIRKFVGSNDYLKKGLLYPNPFLFTDNNISFSWEGDLSYNLIISEWISSYINDLKGKEKLDDVSFVSFCEYLKEQYDLIFNQGIGVNEFICTKNFTNIVSDLLNYKYITEILLMVLNPQSNLKDFCDKYKSICDKDTYEDDKNKIQLFINNDQRVIEVTSEQNEIFDYAYIELSKKYSEEYAISCFKHFALNGDYRVFTRSGNVRNMLSENKITPLVMKKIIYEEMITSLINASVETIKKYDTMQLARAIFGIKKGDYNAFTNEKNARKYLSLMVGADEIDALLNNYLSTGGYKPKENEENYWLFVELMSQRVKEKAK